MHESRGGDRELFFFADFFSLSCIYWISFSDFLCIDITVYNLSVYESVDLDLTKRLTNMVLLYSEATYRSS